MKLEKFSFDKKNIVPYGNMFLIGNGHLGYRGTLEEYRKEQLVGLNVVGFYDKYQDKWRESVNLPNPFYVTVKDEFKTYSVLEEETIFHQVKLDISKAIFSRKSEFKNIIISSKRFLSCHNDQTLDLEYKITSKIDNQLEVTIGLDLDLYEINGPHYITKEVFIENQTIYFYGTTNEGKKVTLSACYSFPRNTKIITRNNCQFIISIDAKKDKTYYFYCHCYVIENKHEKVTLKASKKGFLDELHAHSALFLKKFNFARVRIPSNKLADFSINYSIYHLLILENEKYFTSIPARGLSGQVYKGAIFWDTEIFLLPFYSLTNPSFARNLLVYRINTLKGALSKAKEFGYQGAFYAWESQDDGLEACSKYNVSDPITHEGIRTYFNEKQIHISADIVYAFDRYIMLTGDKTILDEGGYEVLKEVSKFFISYSTLIDNQYHLLDVIGPDEYHERVDDNAFTNYMAYKACSITYKYLLEKENKSNDDLFVLNQTKKFMDNLYLPPINSDGLIEQFSGYYSKEDCTVETVKSRLKHPNEYWGTSNGVAYPTRIIKQADVMALVVLLREYFKDEVIKRNYYFYNKYTEHGSSLSASMYSISGFWIDEFLSAYNMFYKSSYIDLGTDQKMFAGGIYIGGTHPASEGGAYLSLIQGYLGFEVNGNGFKFNPKYCDQLKNISFNFYYKGKRYKFIQKKNKYFVEEL